MPDGFNRIHPAIHIAFHGMDAAFAIICRTNDHSLGNKLLAQFHVIHYVAVMCANHVTIRVQVGLGIHLRWCTKGSPAELQNPPAAGHF